MLVFWDIDGTLLTTARAGIHAWEDALQETAGVTADLRDFDTAGHPDYGIARQLLIQYAAASDPEPDLLARLVRRYEDLLPAALGRRAGWVLPNVQEILVSLGRTGASSMLLTGNTRRGAEAKLTHYGLAEFFDDGAFSEQGADRAAIARAAMQRATAVGRVPEGDSVFVIGDTPHDVACAGAIGARAVGVATGSYDASALARTGAWRVLPQLPPAAEFLALLQHGRVAADA